MPPLGLYLAFVAAATLFIAIPGPNVAVIIAHTLSHGKRAGFATLAGTASGAALQLGVVAAGLAALASVMAQIIEWVRWIGAAYLIYLGLRALFDSDKDSDEAAIPAQSGLYLRGLMTGMSNPKSLLFYTAFLPQFVSPDRPAGPQLMILAVTFILIAVPGDSVWVFAASALKRFASNQRIVRRISGVLLLGAGSALAFARR